MLFNNPANFRDEMIKGYVAAYPDYVTEISGGVARSTKADKDKVVIINGGGSGHYPTFYGFIGDGFMDATAVGNIFTSPSTEDVLHVAHAVSSKKGILLIGGNYAGDKINFNLARDELRQEGFDCQTFFITDDVASSKVEEPDKRRGNAGMFIVFKTAGAAAAAGLSLEEVMRVVTKANACTKTFSLGMRGPILPGASEPLFHVPRGRVEVGQGIHGEPGISECNLPSAENVAELLVQKVLAEVPENNPKRLAVMLNGLGSTKYEELFVVWKSVRELLESKGFVLVEPQVGEFVTSLDMEGITLSVEFLDDELEKYWCAPCDTPSFRKGNSLIKHEAKAIYISEPEKNNTFDQGSVASRKAAHYIVGAFDRMKKMLVNKEKYLATIDSIAGDGDHGRGMVRGSTFASDAAIYAYEHGAAAGSVLIEAGRAWASKAGGTSGVLWGAALGAAGEVVGNKAKVYDADIVAKAVQAACRKIELLGKAHQGDKTMLDVLIPFAEILKNCAAQGDSIETAWRKASLVAEKAAINTANLIPKTGRARPMAKRSLGTPDAGAVSMALCINAVLLYKN